MNMKLTSQFSRGEIEKAAQSLFDLFSVEVSASLHSSALHHLRAQFDWVYDFRGLPDNAICTVYATFDRTAQVLEVWVDNADGFFKNGRIIRIDSFLSRLYKFYLAEEINGLAKLAK